MLLLMAFPVDTSTIVSQFLKEKAGISVDIGNGLIGSALWVGLLALLIRYYQINVFIEKQYTYIHKIEENLEDILNGKYITREGAYYLADYPLFSDFIHYAYNIIFPSILIIATLFKIRMEDAIYEQLGYAFLFDLAIYFLTTLSIIIYSWPTIKKILLGVIIPVRIITAKLLIQHPTSKKE
jgi:hypothetical protein